MSSDLHLAWWRRRELLLFGGVGFGIGIGTAFTAFFVGGRPLVFRTSITFLIMASVGCFVSYRTLHSDRRLAVNRATYILDIWSLILPTRIANEDIGDYIERLGKRHAPWQIYLVMLAAMFWTGANMVGYLWKVLGKTKFSN